MPTKNTMTKTLFIKLYKPKNPLTLKRVSKPIGIRLLNDVAVTEDSTREKISLDLPEIDDIGSSESITPETPRPPELLVPGPFKLPKPENRPLESMFKPPEEPIKPIDSLDPDEIQLDLIISLYYRIKVKIFKKKFDKKNSIPNIYKQILKSPNVKKWLAAIFNEFEQLINLKTFQFLSYKTFFKDRKPLTNRLVFKEKKDQYNVIIKFKTRLVVKSFI